MLLLKRTQYNRHGESEKLQRARAEISRQIRLRTAALSRNRTHGQQRARRRHDYCLLLPPAAAIQSETTRNHNQIEPLRLITLGLTWTTTTKCERHTQQPNTTATSSHSNISSGTNNERERVERLYPKNYTTTESRRSLSSRPVQVRATSSLHFSPLLSSWPLSSRARQQP